jgi:holin-like protein
MIEAITVLLLCQLAGEALARQFGLPVPGPVIGLALLFIALQWRVRRWPDAKPVDLTALGTVSTFFLANLSLLFVPAGTGIVQHAGALITHGPGLIAALVGSTLLTLIVTALVFTLVARRFAREASVETVSALPEGGA